MNTIYNAKWCRINSPEVGTIVTWFEYKFRILSIDNITTQPFRDTNLIRADLVVECLSKIDKNYIRHLESGQIFMKSTS